MGRRPLISGNWKMNLNHFEAIQILQKLSYVVPKDEFEAVDVSVHPPFTDIRSVQTLIEAEDFPFHLGAQHCHWEDNGAFTGEVSPAFLAKLNVEYVIVGHSERREIFGETDDMVNRKVAAIQANGMTPIMCVGETLDEREAARPSPRCSGQVEAGLAGRSSEQVASMVIAYEPIWAIGTGVTATSDDAQAVCAAIRGKSPAVRRRHRGRRAHPVRRLGQGVQRRRVDGPARHRRRAGRRRQPRSGRVRQDRPVPHLTTARGLHFTRRKRSCYRSVATAANVGRSSVTGRGPKCGCG